MPLLGNGPSYSPRSFPRTRRIKLAGVKRPSGHCFGLLARSSLSICRLGAAIRGGLVDEIIPALGSDVRAFISGAELRSPGALLSEDDRTYRLWCAALALRRRKEPLPEDLNMNVLYQRRYVFEWLDGNQPWDDVTCDA